MDLILGIALFMLGIMVGSSITMAVVTKANEKIFKPTTKG